jgi:hypothetical protein
MLDWCACFRDIFRGFDIAKAAYVVIAVGEHGIDRFRYVAESGDGKEIDYDFLKDRSSRDTPNRNLRNDEEESY